MYSNLVSPSIPCGHMAPSDFDAVSDYFSRDQQCKIVVYSLLFGAYNYAYNPITKISTLDNDTSVCYFMFVDRATLMNGHGIKSLLPGNRNPRKISSFIVGGHHSWQLILMDKFPYRDPYHSMKAVKLGAPRIFSNAEWLIYVDTKYIIQTPPRKLIEYADRKMGPGSSLATYAKFYNRIIDDFKGARHRIYVRHFTYKNNSNLDANIAELDRQTNLYRKEGLFSYYHDGVKDKGIDAAILIIRNDARAKRFFCAWQNEVSMFSIRDQLSFHLLEMKFRLNTTRIWAKEMMGKPNLFFQDSRGMLQHPPKTNMFNESNPFPSDVEFHPSSPNKI